MNHQDLYEKELEIIEEEYLRGNLTLEQRNKAILETERDYREEAMESAREAAQRELENW